MSKYKVASLFSGCGGADLGLLGGFKYINRIYKKHPFEIAYAVDVNKRAVDTYNKNFTDKAVCDDIRNVDPSTIPDVDVIVGGFPCQSFSTVNPMKDPDDDRANLYKYMARIVKHKQPKVFVVENVKGMLSLRKGEIYKKIEKEFKKAGYRINYDILNSADYGVPQKRERVFMVGVRKDITHDFLFPEKTHSDNASNELKSWVGIDSVIESLIPDDPKYYFSEKAVQGMKKAKNNMKRGLWQRLDEPCLTITAHLAKVSINSRDPVLLVDPKKEKYRRFSPREAARIQSFPDKFEFVGTQGDMYRQIGEAIAPVVMWYVSKEIIKFLENH